MIRKAHEIMIKDYIILDAFWGMRRVVDIAEKAKMSCFPVADNGRIIGVITENDMIKSHPNRIVLDTMSGRYKYIKDEESVWKAKDMLEQGADVLFVTHQDKIIGMITKNEINIEISKHFDLLTELYKKDYIIYKSAKLLEQNGEISIIFFDINNFGYIDKQLGHAVGDIILKEIAKFLKDNISEGTYLCRYGGDEFVILTDKCGESCKILAQDLLNGIKRHKFYGNIQIDLSVGIAGGKKTHNLSKESMYKTIINLINLASLASTKAKKQKESMVFGYNGIIDEIAI